MGNDCDRSVSSDHSGVSWSICKHRSFELATLVTINLGRIIEHDCSRYPQMHTRRVFSPSRWLRPASFWSFFFQLCLIPLLCSSFFFFVIHRCGSCLVLLIWILLQIFIFIPRMEFCFRLTPNPPSIRFINVALLGVTIEFHCDL